MRSFAHIAVLLMLTAGPVAAQSLGVSEQGGAPAVTAEGRSSTELDVLAESLSLGVEADGSLSARGAGQAPSGEGSLGVEAGSVDLSVQQRAFELTGPGGALIPALDIDPDGNGSIDADERDAVRRFSVDQRDCDGVILSSSSPEQIAAIAASTGIALVLVCADPSGLDPELRAAIAANSALMDRLGQAGYGLANVAGLELSPDGRGTVYVATF